jgi:hypothetical protein
VLERIRLRIVILIGVSIVPLHAAEASCFRRSEIFPTLREIERDYKSKCMPSVAASIERFLVAPPSAPSGAVPSFATFTLSSPRSDDVCPSHAWGLASASAPGVSYSKCSSHLTQALHSARMILLETSQAFPDWYINPPRSSWCSTALHVVLDHYAREYNKKLLVELSSNATFACVAPE